VKKFLCFGLLFLLSLPSHASVVRMVTSVGVIDVKLYDESAPVTVQNFLGYVNRGDYNNTVIHRKVDNFIVQGGGYYINATTGMTQINTQPAIVNEYNDAQPNQRGTIAMAKVSGNPDSATSQWFFNVVDNSQVLGASNNAGYTVFGEVIGLGMKTVDAIAGLPLINIGDFSELPYAGMSLSGETTLVSIRSVKVLATESLPDAERLFNYMEQQYAKLFAPVGSETGVFEEYEYRYYPGTNSYLGHKDGRVYYLGPASGQQITDIGSYDDMLSQALAAGY